MSTAENEVADLIEKRYEHGFVTDIEQEYAPPGLDESIVTFISKKKGEPEWLLEWRLSAYEAWTQMDEPDWAKLKIAPNHGTRAR